MARQLHTRLRQRIDGIQKILMAHHEAGALLPDAVKGSERETLVREFLEKVFPLPFRFGAGAVMDTAGNASGQLDVVVEFPFFPSFSGPGGSQRLYLAESVAFVLEVKSDLSRQWNDVKAAVAKVRQLRRIWLGHSTYDQRPWQTGSGPSFQTRTASLSRIPYVAVGFEGPATLEALSARVLETPDENRPDATLVIESGAYVGTLTDHNAVGAEGFFLFLDDATYFARNVLSAMPDFDLYLADRHDP